MAIRLNLLSEAQALEDLRRRDPVKRAVWIGVLLVIGTLVWSSYIQVHVMVRKGEHNRLQARLSANTNEYQQVLENQKKLNDVTQRLTALRQLATNRFLH